MHHDVTSQSVAMPLLNEERVISVVWYEAGQSLRLLVEAYGTDIAPLLREVAVRSQWLKSDS